MFLTAKEIAKMIDLSCVRTISNKVDIEEMVNAAKKFDFGQVSVLQCFIPYTKTLLADRPDIHIVGNVSFPSGSDSTTTKVFQASEMVAAGCDEIDTVINVGQLKSGMVDEVFHDVDSVVKAAKPLPCKVIIEVMYLTPDEVTKACDICMESGASFVKTGTGWANRGTTVDDIKFISSIVKGRCKIKASGGIRDLHTFAEMYKAGARRFGVNLKSGIELAEACQKLEKGLEI